MKVISTCEENGQLFKKIGNYIYNLADLLGSGNFSKVYSGKNQITGGIVAIKVVELQSLTNPKLEELHRNELDVLQKINHDNVLRCYQVLNWQRQCFIITEVCNGGDLDMFVKREGFLSEDRAATFIKDIYQGLAYLANIHIVHRDIKVANIFINNGKAKIADFGFAIFATLKFRDLNIGSPLYMSPEGFNQCIYGPKTDVWSFGVLIYELLHGDTPYSFCKLQYDLRYHLSLPFDKSKVKSTLSSDLKEVIFRCLESDETKRITISQLRQTNYFRRIYHQLQIPLYPTIQDIRHPLYRTKDEKNEYLVKSHEKLPNLNLEIHHLGKNNQVNILNKQKSNIKINFLTVNKPDMRFGRPISNCKPTINLSPPIISRERLKSIDNKKPIINKYIIFNIQIDFKIAVNIIHYCRGIFRSLQLMILIKQGHKEIKYLTGWLILALEQLNLKLNNHQVIFDGQNAQTKAKKLREVRNQYERKYVNELKTYISSFISKPSLQDIKLYLFLQYRKYDIAILQQATPQYIQLGHLIVLLYDLTRILKKCQQQGNFTRFLHSKDMENVLGWVKEKFDLNSYQIFKKRMIINT